MSNRELPMMPWFPDQFAASTAGWTFIERAIYRALLDLQWQQGTIFRDVQRLSRALDVDVGTLKNHWSVVGPKFAAVEGGLQNYRLEQHRLAALELHMKRVAGGRSRQAQLKATSQDSSSPPVSSPQAHLSGLLQHPSPSLKNKKLSSSSLTSARKRSANGQGGRAAPERSLEPGTMREDDPDIQRKRREAETLAAQHAKPKDEDMPF